MAPAGTAPTPVTIARYTLIEARRSGLPWLVLGAAAVALAIALFIAQVALTESVQTRTAIVAALLRLAAVFLVVLHVATSVQREHADKIIDLMLSLPIARTTQYLGRWAGYAACGALIALVFALPLATASAPAALAAWVLSLALETMLMAAATLFFSMVLVQLVPAVAATLGLYVLARSMSAIQAIASGPLATDSLPQQLARWCVDGVALLLPRLERVTSTDWLLYGMSGASGFLAGAASMLVYTALLLAAGLIDFRRRNL